MRRSFGLSLLSFFFFWLTVAGIANPVVATKYPSRFSGIGLRPTVLAPLAAIYAITAAAVTFAAWTERPWLPPAISLWGATLLVYLLAFQVMIRAHGEPLWLLIMPYMFFAGLTWILARYATRKVRRGAA
jgi:hypothetical protein